MLPKQNHSFGCLAIILFCPSVGKQFPQDLEGGIWQDVMHPCEDVADKSMQIV